MSALTLERLQEEFGGFTAGGEFAENHNRIVTSIDLGAAGGVLSCHVILDAEEPDGFRIYCRHENRIPALEDSVRAKLGLPPRPRSSKAILPANDNRRAVVDDTIDADTLMGMEFAPLNYIVPGYVVEGLTILGGKPKMGKSWWAYDVGIAIATGGRAMGKVDCEQGDVLYLALEDNHRRVKDRINVLRPFSKKLGGLSRLSIRTKAPMLDAGLIEELEKWRAKAANPRLIIIDVFMKVRPARKRGEDPYQADYAAVTPLQQYASEKRLAVLVVTHTRKMEAEDPLEAISGTNGVTGAADAVLVISRDSKGTTLFGRGRDLEDVESAMKFTGGQWTLIGDADEVRKSAERRKIIATLKDADVPMMPKDIAKETGMKEPNVRVLLRTMKTAGEVEQPDYGLYSLPTPITPVTLLDQE